MTDDTTAGGVGSPLALDRLTWSRLNHLQVGRYAEYLVKMEFTLYGFQVYSAEVDDRGVDFVCRKDKGPFFEVQVKSVRGLQYVFFPKQHFEPADSLVAAVVLFFDGEEPRLFLVPSVAWREPDRLLVEHDYGGLKSRPEYGLNVSKRNMPLLERFDFGETVARLTG
ncbi:MAG TPA: hypothetical protein PKD75_02115 [Tepidiformaceae bacterium]|nr:hypothetical protein [Tepidiformaceae bacterium]